MRAVVLLLLCSVVPVLVDGSRLHHVPDITDRPFLSMQELEEFADLSEDNARNQFMNMLIRLDNGLDAKGEPVGNGGDKALSRGEVAVKIVRVQSERQRYDASYHLDETDADDDGLASWDELKLHVDKLAIPQVLVAQRFLVADEDKNKYLSPEEVKAFFHPDSHPSMFNCIALEILFMLDENKDQFLSFEEVQMNRIKKVWSNIEDYAVDLDHLPLLFTYLDANDDRKLDVNDLKKFLSEHYDRRIEELVDAIFEVADSNKDDKLTVNELWDTHEHFIGTHHDRQHGTTPPHKIADALERRHHRDDAKKGHHHHGHDHDHGDHDEF
jgi:Ca2+-binding EF-hand superfamily protein